MAGYLFRRMKLDLNEENIVDWLRERIDDDEFDTAASFINNVLEENRSGRAYRETSEAKMKEYDDRIKDYDGKLQEQKAKNYDLLMQIPANDHIDGDGVVVEDVSDDGEVYHIDNLFVDDDETERMKF